MRVLPHPIILRGVPPLQESGLLAKGYNLILADDCWIADNRSR